MNTLWGRKSAQTDKIHRDRQRWNVSHPSMHSLGGVTQELNVHIPIFFAWRNIKMRHHLSARVSLCVHLCVGTGLWVDVNQHTGGYFSITLVHNDAHHTPEKHYCPRRWWTKGSTHHCTGASPQSDSWLAHPHTHTRKQTNTRAHTCCPKVAPQMYNKVISQKSDIIYIPHELLLSYFNLKM